MRKAKVVVAIGVASILLMVLPTYARDILNVAEWKALIMSGSEKERVLAKRTILKHKEVLAQNEELIEELISIVRSPVIEREAFYSSTTSRNIAIFLLGKLRVKKAVPYLIDWLVPKKGQGLATSREMVFSPAGYALVEIGLPSIPPLVEKLRSEGTSILGKVCLKVIIRINGLEESEFLLQQALSEETNPTKKNNLRAALELVENPNSVLKALDNTFKIASSKAD